MWEPWVKSPEPPVETGGVCIDSAQSAGKDDGG